MRSVTVGESRYEIPTFRGYKGVLAGIIVSRAFEQLKDVFGAMERFRREWAEENPVRMTRDMAAQRLSSARAGASEIEQLLGDEDAFQGRVAEDNADEWADESKRDELMAGARQMLRARLTAFQGSIDSSERTLRDIGERPYIELPGEPEDWQIYAVGFTKAMEVAPAEVKKLLGLVVIANRDLEEADAADEVDQKLEQIGRRILFDGEVEEVVKLAAEAGEVLYEQQAKARGALGKLQALYRRATDRSKPKESEPEPETTETTKAPETSTPSSPPSSTSSPAPTDGPEERPSSESPGVSSAPSAAA